MVTEQEKPISKEIIDEVANIPLESEWTETSTERHDLYTFETKVDYNIHKDSQKNEFDLSLYFFMPRSFQINDKTYPKERFYADLNNHIRFKTPRIAISGLINEKNSLSPLNQISGAIEKIKNGEDGEELFEKLVYDLRELGAIIKSAIRDQVRYFVIQYKSSNDLDDIIPEFHKFLSEIEQLQARMRQLSQEFLIVQIPARVRETFSYVDEYMSLQVQNEITAAITLLQDNPSFADVKSHFIKVTEYEQKHRRVMNSQLIRKPGSNNESYTYWEGILKKYIQGILYLTIKDKDEESKALQLFYSFAAGFAMFLSLMLGLWIASFYTDSTGNVQNTSMTYILALVVAYIIKDRIKDSLRAYSPRIMRVLFPDKKHEIIDTRSKKKIGVTKESVRFMNWDDVPPEILNIRTSSNKSSIEHEGKPEVVLKYDKTVKLNTSEITKLHGRHDIFDIIRFNVRNIIQYADDPVKPEKVWNMEVQKIIDIPCAKVYHLNLIFKLHALDYCGHELTTYKKVRVILDQQGIERVEEVRFKF